MCCYYAVDNVAEVKILGKSRVSVWVLTESTFHRWLLDPDTKCKWVPVSKERKIRPNEKKVEDKNQGPVSMTYLYGSGSALGIRIPDLDPRAILIRKKCTGTM
jgi:hypothetical protein